MGHIMRKDEFSHRFGPDLWVTIRNTGEHVKIETWSNIAASYRVRSAKGGVFYLTDAEVDEVVGHPEEHLGKCWRRCRNTACGAPLTPGLPVCEHCQAPTCTCGRCECVRVTAAARARAKTARRRATAVAK